MHEFVLKGIYSLWRNIELHTILMYFFFSDVAAVEFRQIKGVQSILLALLSADEMYISRVVLRTIKFMAHGQGICIKEHYFLRELIHLIHCHRTISTGDGAHWIDYKNHALFGV
jgi:hypothetical protein